MTTKLNMSQFIDDCKNGVLELSEQQDGGINLSNYIMRYQSGTKVYDYINKDVSWTYYPQDDYFEVEDYGNGSPDWTYKVRQDMQKAMKAYA